MACLNNLINLPHIQRCITGSSTYQEDVFYTNERIGIRINTAALNNRIIEMPRSSSSGYEQFIESPFQASEHFIVVQTIPQRSYTPSATYTYFDFPLFLYAFGTIMCVGTYVFIFHYLYITKLLSFYVYILLIDGCQV